jgi:DNA helicase-2/ATP-dependent DNA helicase PcrA
MDESSRLERSEVDDLRRLLEALGRDRGRMVDFLASGRLSDLMDVRSHSVKVLTMHSAKGLEFDTVFAAGCEEKVLPWTFGRHEADPGEEMRLLYVAMTRARERLVITHAARRRLWGREIDTGPSPFLRSLEPLLPIRTVRKVRAAPPDRKKQLKLF